MFFHRLAGVFQEGLPFVAFEVVLVLPVDGFGRDSGAEFLLRTSCSAGVFSMLVAPLTVQDFVHGVRQG